ncbi:methionine ABC transporter ATP-binding protein [Arthrobacter ginkgonis]|uniref:Methionine ABC transporter ATP-binding protein n=1 Tax=Arthrobacter ginkgonis TaxID=1630594 RepID=A0ABP7DD60_9MICC
MSAATAPPQAARGAVRFEHVTKTYVPRNGKAGTAVTALDDVTLELPAGRITGVIGRSGAGKSTLLRTVNLLERPTSGRVLLDGEDIATVTGPALRDLRRRIGMVFQHFSLMASKTVWENVRLPLRLAGVNAAEADLRVAELLELVGLDHRADAYPGQLSGGQKQRVGIARALVQDPEILLCDEATSALDPETTHSILALLRRINRERGVTILLITHEMAVIQEICDEVAVIDGGRVVEHGPVWRVLSAPAHGTTRALLHSFRRNSAEELGAEVAGVEHDGDARLVLRFDGLRPVDVAAVVAHLQHDAGSPVQLLASSISPVQGRPQGHLVVAAGAPDAEVLLERARAVADRVEVL